MASEKLPQEVGKQCHQKPVDELPDEFMEKAADK